MDFLKTFLDSSIYEKIAFCCSILYVVTAAKQLKYCWVFPIISSAIYIHLTFIVNLYFESILNFFYVIVAIKGLWEWNKIKSDNENSIHFKPIRFHIIITTVGFFLVFVLGYLAQFITNQSLSYLDAFTTIFSFITTYMVVKKIIENWIYWIVIDAASVYLYYSKKLHLTAFLFFVFTIMAVYGFFNWKKIMLTQKKIIAKS